MVRPQRQERRRRMKPHHFKVIEMLSYWEGKITARILSEVAELGIAQSKKYITTYRQQCPGNIQYHRKIKHYVPSPSFTPQFITADVNEYLTWRRFTQRYTGFETAQYERSGGAVCPSIMRQLMLAIEKRQRVDVEYVSLTHPQNEGRIIQPHSIVQTSQRCHIRAWDESRERFSDFVISRFRGAADFLGPATKNAEEDTDWQTKVDMIFQPDPRLSTEQREIIEHDYQMENGQLIVSTRAALATYRLQEMLLSSKVLDTNPQAQQLILVNENDLKPWLF